MNTTTAATQAGVTVPTIRTWCRLGAIDAVKTSGRWAIDAASLAHRITIGTWKKATVTETYPWDDDHPEHDDLMRLVQAGITPEQIVDALGSDAQGMGRHRPFNGKSRRWMDHQLSTIEARAQEQQDTAQAQARRGLATDRQISYILDLLAKRHHDGDDSGFYYGPTDRAGIAKMTRAEASTYITSLKGEY